MLQLPLVVLFEEDGAEEPGDAGFVGEDANDVGAPLDLFVQPFDGIGRMDFGPVGGWEGLVGQNLGLGLVHQRGVLGNGS